MKRKRRVHVVFAALFSVLVCVCFVACNMVKVMPLEGILEFTDVYDPDATVCIPAAYTGKDGNIEGLYRIDGRTMGSKTLKERVSLHPSSGMVISPKWHSDNGFQQHVLVKDGRVRRFRDKRMFRRRALCSDASNPGKLYIIESRCPMTMNGFARVLSRHSTDAVNLDMGRWGYGWIGRKKLMRWAAPMKDKQTNWIVVK